MKKRFKDIRTSLKERRRDNLRDRIGESRIRKMYRRAKYRSPKATYADYAMKESLDFLYELTKDKNGNLGDGVYFNIKKYDKIRQSI